MICFMRLAALLLTVWAGNALAADPFPTRPITMIVPFAPGGAADAIGRVITRSLGEKLGQTIVIENRGGAGGGIGAVAVARAAPDGYTMLLGSTATQAINPSLYKSLAYDPEKDFAAVGMVAFAPHVIVVSATSQFKTLNDLIAYGRANPNMVTFGSGGVGTPTHLAGEIFARTTGVEMRHVPYRGSGPALTDLMGNRITVEIDSLSAVLPFVTGGRLLALAQTGATRAAALPNVPTTAEAGLSSLEVTGWFGLFVPAGTKDEIVQRLSRALAAALNEPETRSALASLGATPGAIFHNEFGQYVKADAQRWAGAVKSANVKLD